MLRSGEPRVLRIYRTPTGFLSWVSWVRADGVGGEAVEITQAELPHRPCHVRGLGMEPMSCERRRCLIRLDVERSIHRRRSSREVFLDAIHQCQSWRRRTSLAVRHIAEGRTSGAVGTRMDKARVGVVRRLGSRERIRLVWRVLRALGVELSGRQNGLVKVIVSILPSELLGRRVRCLRASRSSFIGLQPTHKIS